MANTRKPISKKLRFEVFKRDSFTCQYCGLAAPQVILHADHIHPVSQGGQNDILNLITSCLDCNLGKRDRLLSDDSAVTKQKVQLDELQERRKQLEMMIEWREGLGNLEDLAYNAAAKEWERLTGWDLSESGVLELKKLLRKWGLNSVMDAMGRASVYLEPDRDEHCTTDSFNVAFDKLGGICRMMSLPEWQQEIYHIRNIARKRAGGWWHNSSAAEVLTLLEKAYKEGVPLEDLKSLALVGHSYTNLTKQLEELIVNG